MEFIMRNGLAVLHSNQDSTVTCAVNSWKWKRYSALKSIWLSHICNKDTGREKVSRSTRESIDWGKLNPWMGVLSMKKNWIRLSNHTSQSPEKSSFLSPSISVFVGTYHKKQNTKRKKQISQGNKQIQICAKNSRKSPTAFHFAVLKISLGNRTLIPLSFNPIFNSPYEQSLHNESAIL